MHQHRALNEVGLFGISELAIQSQFCVSLHLASKSILQPVGDHHVKSRVVFFFSSTRLQILMASCLLILKDLDRFMKPKHFRPWIPACCFALLAISGHFHPQTFAARRSFQVHHVPGKATMDEVFPFHQSCLGLHLDDGPTILHVAHSQAVASLDLAAMDRKELKKLKEVLENPKCIKVGVNLTSLIRAFSDTESDWSMIICLVYRELCL